jgi:hypothetical protein
LLPIRERPQTTSIAHLGQLQLVQKLQIFKQKNWRLNQTVVRYRGSQLSKFSIEFFDYKKTAFKFTELFSKQLNQ